MVDWWWYKKPITKSVFLHFLLLCSNEERDYQWQKLFPWECSVGRKETSECLGITEREYRTALEHLKTTNEIAIKTTNRYSVITVLRRADYQENPKNRPAKWPASRPTSDQQTTTKEEYKEEKKKEVFEKIWKEFPHARTSNKKLANENYISNPISDDEIMEELKLLKRQIELWIVNQSFLKALERWIRDITPTSEIILNNNLKDIVFKIMSMEWEERKSLWQKLINDFWVDAIEKHRKERSKNKWIVLNFKK